MPTVPLIRRKTIGKHVIWERKPKPKGVSKYFVTIGDAENEHVRDRDFSRYALAVLWCKAQEPRTVPHVVILIENGLVMNVLSTMPCNYTVADYDEEETTDPRLIPIPMRDSNKSLPCHVHGDNAEVDPDRIATILNTIQPIKLDTTPIKRTLAPL